MLSPISLPRRCRSVRRRLVAYQDHELSPAMHTRVEQHLQECGSCRARDAALREVTPEAPTPQPPPMDPDWSLLDAALAAARRHDDRASRRPSRRRPLRHLPALAAGLVIGLLATWGMHSWLRASALEAQIATMTVAADGPLPSSALRPTSWRPPNKTSAPQDSAQR